MFPPHSALGSGNVTVSAESVKSRPKLCFDKKEAKTRNEVDAPEMAGADYEGIRDAMVKPLLVEVGKPLLVEVGKPLLDGLGRPLPVEVDRPLPVEVDRSLLV